MKLIMDTKTILCNHCRQKLSVNPNETSVMCPGCKLQSSYQLTDYQSSGYEKPSREMAKLRLKASLLLSLMTRNIRNESPKRPLNSKPSPFMPSPSPRPSKRAVLCGVSYKKGKFRLKGSINDVKNMRHMLTDSFGFQVEGILVLTEEEEPEHMPTRKNIQRALQWLVEGCQRGDSLVFYFSGHGLRQPDFTGDELDGFDETICPLDFQKEGMILDNDINSAIVRPLKEGVTLHAIVDACHSGTILDLEYVYNRNEGKWEDNKPLSGANKATSGGLAICLSACEDNQFASDTSALTGKSMNGMMTYIMTDIVMKYPGLTYGKLLDLIYERIEDLRKTECLMNTRFVKRIFGDRLSQRPLLSSSEEFNAYNKQFIL